MSQEREHQPAPPHHSNVVSGEQCRKLAEQGWRDTDGVIHHFNMQWPCGHSGDAVQIRSGDPSKGSLKACAACARQYNM